MPSNQRKHKGRGATINPDSRYTHNVHIAVDDGWSSDAQEPEKLHTCIITEQAKSVITYNRSPDLPFDRSINPYRGCEHGCSYCYARPTHAYLDLSPGLDFESKLYVKSNIEDILIKELSAKNYRPETIVLGANTDPYQPIEKQYRSTRKVLQILHRCKHPVMIISKGSLIEQDIDLLSSMAQQSLLKVMLSVTTLDKQLARKLEPRAAAPHKRLQLIEQLTNAGIPTGIMLAPLIPQINDGELESILQHAAECGVESAAYVMLRLPLEVLDIFSLWLQEHYPLKAKHVLNTVRDVRQGKTNDSEFGSRLTGKGAYADMLAQRFSLQCKKLNLNKREQQLDNSVFVAPTKTGAVQMSLFD